MDYKKIFKNRELRLKLINCLRFIPAKPYLKLVYRIKAGKKLNLKNPVTFCDKQNWLKLHNIHPEYTELVDKIAVREHIKEILGEEYLFPIYGSWEHFNQIDFDKLPDKFVLKCNHDSGSVKVITDKSKIDKNELEKFFEDRLKLNPYVFGREYPYKNVKPCIMAEKFMTPDGEEDINDYKFFCFNGKPEIMFIATDRSTDVKFDFFDMEFRHLPFRNGHPNATHPIACPPAFEKMKELAAVLSKGIPQLRVDFYDINGQVYFGELTFFHHSGLETFEPEAWDEKFGEWIKL